MTWSSQGAQNNFCDKLNKDSTNPALPTFLRKPSSKKLAEKVMELNPIVWLYSALQWLLDALFTPPPPKAGDGLHRPRIAVIGTGLTGVSAAAHCVGHGFDVALFEAGDQKNLGGIWSRVNNTSGLQIHSLMYRFHPSVRFDRGYPDRQQIVSQIRQLWQRYGLEPKAHFNTRVERVYQEKDANDLCTGRWIVNDPGFGTFDGVIPAVGTCGAPKMAHIEGQADFRGEICHSSQLDGRTAEGKRVAIVGGGASAVEGLEFVLHTRARFASVLARSDKWIIPRNFLVDVLLAFNIFGEETMLSWIPEALLRRFFYRDLADLAPPPGAGQGLFTGTPMVNSDVLSLVRQGKAEWLRGDIERFTRDGLLFNHRGPGVPKGGPGRREEVRADMVILATGFHRPSLGFLPGEVFEPPYAPPAWYLQCFPPPHVAICAANCTYANAIGTVGSWHIGIYTRLLLVFLVDPLARPRPRGMRWWIDMTRWIKSRAPTKAFDFFTYSELVYWFVFCVAINPFRWKWAPFVLFGIGSALPLSVVRQEDHVRNGLGMRAKAA